MEPSSAFAAIYRDHHGRLLEHAHRMGLPRDEAADVTQEVFIALYLAMLDERIDLATVGAWLFAATRSKALRRFATLKRRGMPSPILETALEPTVDETDRRVSANDDLMLARRLLNEVDEHLRDVFILREIDEATLEAISATLGRPVTTVARHHKAAREQFDAALSRHRAEERRTSRGAASILVPVVPVSSLVQKLLAWIKKPVALLMSRGGLAGTAASVFGAGAALGALAGHPQRPAPCPHIDAPSPIFAAAPAPVEPADSPLPPAPAPTVLAGLPPLAVPTPPRPTDTLGPRGEERCLEKVANKLTPPAVDPNEASHLLQQCEQRFHEPAFPERFTALRRQIQEALARPPEKPRGRESSGQ